MKLSINNILALTLLAATVSGCRSTLRQAESRPALAPVAVPAQAPVEPRGMADESIRKLDAAVFVRGKSMEVTEAVQHGVEGALADCRYTLRDPACLAVTISLDEKATGKMGNYVKYQGTADASVLRTWDEQIVAKKSFSVIGDRKLGDTEAKRAMAAALSKQIADWLPTVMSADRVGLEARDITISRAWQDGKDTEYANLFAAVIPKMHGVVSCTLVEQNHSARRMTFRVVYLKELIPSGLVNRIAGIPALNLSAKD